MPLRIKQRDLEGIAILNLEGRLVLGPETASFHETIDALHGSGRNNVLLDLKELVTIDSTGLGALVAAHSTLSKAAGALKLLHLSKRNVELLVLTKLSTVFPLFDDEQDAVDSFFPQRERKRFDILDFVTKHQVDEPLS